MNPITTLPTSNKDANIWETIFDSVEDVVLIINKDYKIENINRKGCELFEINPEADVNCRCYELICKNSTPPKNCPLSCHLRGGVPEENLTICSHGRTFRVNTTSISNEQGHIELLVDVLHDITVEVEDKRKLQARSDEYHSLNEEYLTTIEELHEKNEILAEQEVKYRRMFEESALGMFKISAEGKFLNVNSAFLSMVGYNSLDDLQNHISDIRNQLYVHPEKQDHTMSMLRTQPEKKCVIEAELYRADGSILYSNMHVRLLYDDYQKSEILEGFIEDISVRKAQEKALLQSEARYRAMFAENKSVMLLIDPKDHRIMEANEAAIQFYGYPRHTLLQKRIDEINTLSPEEVKKEIDNAIQENRNSFFFKHKLANGQIRDVQVYSGRITHEDKPVLFSIIHDISEQRIAELKLIESEHRYRSLFDNMNSAFALHKIIKDDEGKAIDYLFLECNAKFEELTGLKVADIKGKTVLEVLPNTEPYWIETYAKVAFTGEPISYTNYARELDQHFQVKAYSPEKGYFAVTFHNITDRIKAEYNLKEQIEESQALNEELEESNKRIHQINKELEDINARALENEALLLSIFNSTPVMMVLLDEDTSIIEMNDTCLSNVGSLPKEVFGKQTGEVFRCIGTLHNPLGCGRGELCKSCKIRQTIENTLQTGKPSFKVEADQIIVGEKDHQIHTFLISTSLIYKKGKKNVLVSLDDITERKNMENELILARNKAVESDKLKSSFLANMSHEIRTPLNGIMGFTELLTGRQNLTEEQKTRYASVIRKSTEGLLQIINDILEISRIESGNVEINIKPLNLQRLLLDLEILYMEKIKQEKNSLRLICRTTDADIILATDPIRLQQIFINLLNNAFKFTNEGIIEFGIHKKSSTEIIFFVKDTGIGINPHKHKIIFERFRQAEETVNRPYGGNGLGLAIVKDLLSLLQGKIWLNSEPGKGTVFYFSIPRRHSKTEKS